MHTCVELFYSKKSLKSYERWGNESWGIIVGLVEIVGIVEVVALAEKRRY